MALSDNLVAYWSLEETSGTRVDAHGANDLTDTNTVTSATGKVGTAADFERGNTEYLTIASNDDVQMGDIDFTLAAWVQLESENSEQIIGGKWLSTGNQRAYSLRYQSASDRFLFYVSNNGTAQVSVTANNFGAITTATWYFVVAWHDATANTINISVNAGTADSASHTTGVFATSTGAFRLGFDNSGSAYWDGLIDEVGLWKRVLTADEITELYNSGNGRDYAYISAGGTTYNQSADGTLTSAGALIRSTGKVIAGTLTSAGALLKNTAKAFAGTLTSAGALIKSTAKPMAGALTSAGDLIRTTGKTLAGTLTSAGVLTRNVVKVFIGALTSAGDLATQLNGGAQEFFQNAGGTLTTAGAVLKSTVKSFAGTLTSAGSINKAISKLVVGTLTSAGDLARSTAKSLAGTLTSGGALATARAYLVSLAGTLTSDGVLARSTSKVLAGTLTTAGSISKAIGKALSGTLTSLGSLLAVLAGSVTPHLDVEVSDAAVTVLTLTDSAVYTVTLSDQSRS